MSNTTVTALRPNPWGNRPVIHSSAYVDATAQVIGRVEIGPNVFVGPNAVIRADEANEAGRVLPIVIREDCNVQDGAIIHALAGTEVTIEQRTSLAHGAIVHGPCSIGEGGFIGFGAVVFNSQLGRGVFVSSRAVVENVTVPPETFIPASTCILQDRIRRLRKTGSDERRFMANVVKTNLRLAEGYLGLTPARGDSHE